MSFDRDLGEVRADLGMGQVGGRGELPVLGPVVGRQPEAAEAGDDVVTGLADGRRVRGRGEKREEGGHVLEKREQVDVRPAACASAKQATRSWNHFVRKPVRHLDLGGGPAGPPSGKRLNDTGGKKSSKKDGPSVVVVVVVGVVVSGGVVVAGVFVVVFAVLVIVAVVVVGGAVGAGGSPSTRSATMSMGRGRAGSGRKGGCQSS